MLKKSVFVAAVLALAVGLPSGAELGHSHAEDVRELAS